MDFKQYALNWCKPNNDDDDDDNDDVSPTQQAASILRGGCD